MENKNEKLRLNDELLEKVAGGKSSCYGTAVVPDDLFCPNCGSDQMLMDIGYGYYLCVADNCGVAFNLNGDIFTPEP